MVATNVHNPAFEHLANIYGLHGRSLPLLLVQKEAGTAPIIKEWPGELKNTDRRAIAEFLTLHQRLWVPALNAINYYPLCYEQARKQPVTCVLVLGSDPSGLVHTLASSRRALSRGAFFISHGCCLFHCLLLV